MVRLKIAYWEFDFEAVCPILDHDLLSQAHILLLEILFVGDTIWNVKTVFHSSESW